MAFNNIPPNGFPALPDVEELEAVAKDVAGLKTSVTELAGDVSNLNSNKANQITIAPFFNPETAYDPGDLVYYNGLSYRCVNAHEGEWDADDFAATTIAGELDTLKSGLNDFKNDVLFGNLPSNGFDPLTQCSGFFCFSVYPDLAILQGSPTDYSGYGTIFGCSGLNYKLLVYIDATGKFAVWSQSSAWVAYSSV